MQKLSDAIPEPFLVVLGAGTVSADVIRQCARDVQRKPWRSVVCIVRSEKSAAVARHAGAIAIVADLLDAKDRRWTEPVGKASWLVQGAQPQPSSPTFESDRLQIEDNLARVLLANRSLRRAVFVSGSSFFGATAPGQIVDETATPRPLRPAVGKTVARLDELYAGKLDFFIAFVGAIYGETSWFCAAWRKLISEGQSVPLPAPDALWPLMHAADVARAIEHLLLLPPQSREALTAPKHARYVIISEPEPGSMREFIEALAETVGRPVKFDFNVKGDGSTLHIYSLNRLAHSGRKLQIMGFESSHKSLREGVHAVFGSSSSTIRSKL